jgi:2-oxoglutarate ferredoxin oxidoreductase subunit delta
MDRDQGSEIEAKQTSGAEARPAGEEDSGKPQPQYEIDIFRDWCKSCGICAAFCPRQCLEMDEQGAPRVKNAERCNGCRWCELHCPDFAICVKELAARPAEPEEAE